MKTFRLQSNSNCVVLHKDRIAHMTLKVDDEDNAPYTAWACVMQSDRVHGRDIVQQAKEIKIYTPHQTLFDSGYKLKNTLDEL